MALMGERIYQAALAVNRAHGSFGSISEFEEASDEFVAALEAFGEAAYETGYARGTGRGSVTPGFVKWFAEIRKGGEF